MTDGLQALNRQMKENTAAIIVTDPVLIGLIFVLSSRWHGRQVPQMAGTAAVAQQASFASSLYHQLYGQAFPVPLTIIPPRTEMAVAFGVAPADVDAFVSLAVDYQARLVAPNHLTLTHR